MNVFDREIASHPSSDGERSLELSSAWNIGENPNGGYLMAATLKAMSDLVSQPDPVTLTTHFLRPGLGGRPATISAAAIKPGRTVSTASATLVQEEKLRLTMLAGFGEAAAPDDPAVAGRSIALPMPDAPPPADCVDRAELPQGVALPLLDRVDVRVLPNLVDPDPLKDAAMAGWIRFADGRPPDTLALPLFADAFPPSVFTRFGNIGWVPTLEMTVHVRRRPVDGWIFASFACDDLADGLMIETGSLWDESGALVARSRQLGLLINRTDE